MFGVIIGFDIKDYSQNEKTADMKEQRKIFSDIINDSTKDIHIFNRKEIIDTGDGCFLLIDTGDYENILLAMEKIQEKANKMINIFFRGVVHVGKYEKTDNIIDEKTPNFIGEGINEAARYLNANCLKELLEINDKCFVFGITSEFYSYALHLDNFDINSYERYGFQVKKFSSLLYLNIKNITTKPKQEKIIKNVDFKIKDHFNTFLKKSDFIYEKNNQECDLDAFYIFPELRIDKPEKDDPTKILSDDLIDNNIKNPFNIIIAGDDQSGKTSLCKQYFIRLFESRDFIPIYLSMRAEEKGNVINKISKCLNEQYDKKNIDDGLDSFLKILIIDDFHLLDNIQQKKYLQFINEQKNYMSIIFVDLIFMRSMDKKKQTAYYKEYTIREFGHYKRIQLIDKWIEYRNDVNTNFNKTDELSEYINNTFLKGIMPFTPFYILTVLAAKEDFVQINGELTSKGHCYQALIYISLKKMNIAEEEIGAFLNILSNIAFYFFERKIEMFSEEEMEDFLNEYSKKYNMPFEKKYFYSKMGKSFIFQKNSLNQYSFYAAYLYHYFAARYISIKISDESIKNNIREIYNNLDDQNNAYIGIFIIHHCKDISLINVILDNVKLLYNEYDESSLTRDEINHIEEDAKIVNKEVIEAYDKSEEERKKRLIMQDEEDEKDEYNCDEKVEVNKAVQRIKNAIRTVEVMGHILKNHSGELELEHLKICFLNALNAYRRICNMFIIEFKNNKDNFIDFVNDRIHGIDGSMTLDEKSSLAHRYYIFYNLSAIYSTIIRSANALGSKSLLKVMHEVINDLNNPIGYCVYFQCKMWYEKDVSINDIKSKYDNFPETVKFIMRRLIKEYTDLHHIEYREKQIIASKFDMDVKHLTYDYEK